MYRSDGTRNTEHGKVRKRVISILTNEPLLTIFNPNFPIELHTDASADGYGAILFHRIVIKPRIIEYFEYSYELETLAVCFYEIVPSLPRFVTSLKPPKQKLK